MPAIAAIPFRLRKVAACIDENPISVMWGTTWVNNRKRVKEVDSQSELKSQKLLVLKTWDIEREFDLGIPLTGVWPENCLSDGSDFTPSGRAPISSGSLYKTKDSGMINTMAITAITI